MKKPAITVGLLFLLAAGAGCSGDDEPGPLNGNMAVRISEAVAKGDYSDIGRIIDGGWDPSLRFIDKSWNPECGDTAGGTILHYVVFMAHLRGQSVELIKYFINKGANINARSDCGRTPLHEAVLNADRDVINTLISLGADVNMGDNEGTTPLHAATIYQKPGVIECLMEKGADPSAKDNKGYTPLDYAYDEFFCEPILRKKGAKSGEKYRDELIQAVMQDDIKKLKALTELGANMETRDGKERTLLHFADTAEIAAFLIEKGLDVNARDRSQETPLHQAWKPKTIRLLIYYGAEPDVWNSWGKAPIHERVEANQLEAVNQLLSCSADINAKMRVKLVHPEQFLYRMYGWVGTGGTALHIAAVAGFEEMVKLLVEHGADINATDKDGKTPLDIAKKDEIVGLLKSHSALSGKDPAKDR